MAESDATTHQLLLALRSQMASLYRIRDLPVRIPTPHGDTTYTIALPADPDAPLDTFAVGHTLRLNAPEDDAAREAREMVEAGTHMPYWGLLWASGQALAETMLAEPTAIAGQRALELGCGLGLTAAAALAAGARLTAVDCFAEALLFTRYNALRATGAEPATHLIDWRTEAGRAALLTYHPVEALLAADVLYEQEDCAPLLALVPQLLQRGGVFWLAEPGRRVAQIFVAEALAQGWRDTPHIYDRAWLPDGDAARVVVHRLQPPAPDTHAYRRSARRNVTVRSTRS